jgi:hypothetical protein
MSVLIKWWRRRRVSINHPGPLGYGHGSVERAP